MSGSLWSVSAIELQAQEHWSQLLSFRYEAFLEWLLYLIMSFCIFGGRSDATFSNHFLAAPINWAFHGEGAHLFSVAYRDHCDHRWRHQCPGCGCLRNSAQPTTQWHHCLLLYSGAVEVGGMVVCTEFLGMSVCLSMLAVWSEMFQIWLSWCGQKSWVFASTVQMSHGRVAACISECILSDKWRF